ncbi:MAG: DUF1549 domain-containing protein, partial [Planctomycetales bacterium]|nr:DUF1549 domain-containing protein [Planctomycetales bacterium]
MKRFVPSLPLLLIPLIVPLAISSLARADDASAPVSFNRDIRPLLADRCFQCHGPAEGNREGGLRLDRADGAEGAYRTAEGSTAIKPGKPEESAVWNRIRSDDPDEVMPPPDAHKKPLTAEELELVRRWIASGAEYEGYWAFAPIERPANPDVQHRDWSDQPIDLFVRRRLESEQLGPKPRADRRTLIRRLTLDLTGLPPTRREIADFLADSSPDAYERLVDRLLNKPQYGEQMARYWLDLVRFADTNGIHHDHYRDL